MDNSPRLNRITESPVEWKKVVEVVVGGVNKESGAIPHKDYFIRKLRTLQKT
jgi:hypothetical protein